MAQVWSQSGVDINQSQPCTSLLTP